MDGKKKQSGRRRYAVPSRDALIEVLNNAEQQTSNGTDYMRKGQSTVDSAAAALGVSTAKLRQWIALQEPPITRTIQVTYS